MSLSPEEPSRGKEANGDEIFVKSLLGMNILEDPPQESIKRFEETLRTYSKISSERWRDNICTVGCRTDTKVSLSFNLFIYPDDLLSIQEVEQRRLRRNYFKKTFDKSSSQKLNRIWENIEQIEKNYASAQSKSTTHKGSEDEQKKQESASQTTEDNLGTSETSTEVSPSEPLRGTDTSETYVDVSPSEPRKDTETKFTDVSPSGPQKGTDAISTDVSPSERQKRTNASIDDHVFAVPAIPALRSSSRLKKTTEKDPKKSDQSGKSKSTSDVEPRRFPMSRTPSRDSPDPRPRRSSRLSSRSTSDDDGDNSEGKSKVEFSKRKPATTPGPKEPKEVENSGGDESTDDSQRSTSRTRASRRLKK